MWPVFVPLAVHLLPERQRHAGQAEVAAVLHQVAVVVGKHAAGDRHRQRQLLERAASCRSSGRACPRKSSLRQAVGVALRDQQLRAGEQRVVEVAEFARAADVVIVRGVEIGRQLRALKLDARGDRVDPFVDRLLVGFAGIELLHFIDIDRKTSFSPAWKPWKLNVSYVPPSETCQLTCLMPVLRDDLQGERFVGAQAALDRVEDHVAEREAGRCRGRRR